MRSTRPPAAHLAAERRDADYFRPPLRKHQSARHYGNANRRSCLAFPLPRCGDHGLPGVQAHDLFPERRYGRHQHGLAGGRECRGIGV